MPLIMAQKLVTIEAKCAGTDKGTHETETSKVNSKAAAGGKPLLQCELKYVSDGKQLNPLGLTFPN